VQNRIGTMLNEKEKQENIIPTKVDISKSVETLLEESDLEGEPLDQYRFLMACEYIKSGKLSEFAQVLETFENVNLIGVHDSDKNTLLHYCAACNELEMAKLLLNRKAIQIPNLHGETALDLARCGVEDGDSSYEAMVKLLESGS